MIDFFKEAKDFIDSSSLNTRVDYKETTPKDFKPVTPPEELGEQKELHLYEGLDVSEDGSEIYIKGEVLKVPEWYNKEMILGRDEKTIDMVFIHYSYFDAY